MLAVDCAEESGWSIWDRGKLSMFGHLDMLDGTGMNSSRSVVTDVCELAVTTARAMGIPCILVFERPFRGTSQGAWIGSWKHRWVRAGGVQTRMLGVYPATWRSTVLGRGWGSAKREIARAKEQEVATFFARHFGHTSSAVALAGHGDVAPAICIGKWASHSGEVWSRMPASMREEK